jgi:hypothetical protein
MEAFCEHHCAMASAGKKVFAQFTEASEPLSRLLQVKNDGRQSKNLIPQLATDTEFFNHTFICQSLYDVKPKAQPERCKPHCTIGN